MATGVASWSQTAATNATADSTVNWAEGQAPSSVNDSARAMMASTAKYRDDQAGTLTTAGTSTAYTVTTNQSFASLTALSGNSLRIKFNATNGASPTLAVDGLTAHAIVTVTGTAVGTGSIRANQIYDVVYSNSSTEFIMVGGQPTFEAFFASGTALIFFQAAAPTGWTKSTANNDKAIRIVSGTGGGTGGSTAFTTVFAARTIAQANLPNVNFTVSGSQTHTLTISTAVIAGGGAALQGVSGSNANISSGDVNSTSLVAASGGSGTAVDFAVQYLDCIVCTKD